MEFVKKYYFLFFLLANFIFLLSGHMVIAFVFFVLFLVPFLKFLQNFLLNPGQRPSRGKTTRSVRAKKTKGMLEIKGRPLPVPGVSLEILALLRVGAMLIVLLAYAFWGTYGTFNFTGNFFTGNSHYADLAEGFLSGQLSTLIQPDPRILQLKDPYDHAQNYPYLTMASYDASLYKGKMYLYYGCVPCLAYYVPYKLIFRSPAADSSGLIFFLFLGFIFQFFILMKIKDRFFNGVSEFQLNLAGLALGLANASPFLLARPAVYEVAIASAFCCMSIALFFLYQYLMESRRAGQIVLLSLFLGLSVGCRPNFVVAVVFFLVAFFLYLYFRAPKNKLVFMALCLVVPAGVVGLGLGLYNYLRFDSFFEFGQKYALAGASSSLFHFNLSNLGTGFYMYFFRPFTLLSQFPHIFLSDKAAAFFAIPAGYQMEKVAGFFCITPLALFILVFPILGIVHFFRPEGQSRDLVLYLLSIVCMALLIAAPILMISAATERYLIDFSPYFLFVAIVSAWLWETNMRRFYSARALKILFICLAILSILIGAGLGFTGYYDIFKAVNPKFFGFFSAFL